MSQQQIHAFGGQRRKVFFHLKAIALKEIGCKHRNVLSPYPERRDVDGNDLETIIKILTKFTLRYGAVQIFIGSGYDSGCGAHRFIAPQALKSIVLQHPEQLGLQRQTHVAYFVQKQSAALCLLKLTRL